VEEGLKRARKLGGSFGVGSFTTPVRGQSCIHTDCFEYKAFMRKAISECPICLQTIRKGLEEDKFVDLVSKEAEKLALQEGASTGCAEIVDDFIVIGGYKYVFIQGRLEIYNMLSERHIRHLKKEVERDNESDGEEEQVLVYKEDNME